MELSAPASAASPARRRFASHAARLALVLAVFAAAREPFLTREAVVRGLWGDHGIWGLMGGRIFEGVGFDIFFWGQSYLGPLTPMVAALVGWIRRLLGLAPAYGPLALRLAGLLELGAGTVFWYFAFAALFDVETATLAALLLAAGPPFLLAAGVATVPPGPEMLYLLGGVLVFMAARLLRREEPAGARDWFLFGLVAGFGWWMNQGIVFFLAAIAVLFLLRAFRNRSINGEGSKRDDESLLREVKRLAPLVGGALLGYGPVLVSRVLFGPPEVRYQGPALFVFPDAPFANLRHLFRDFAAPALGIEAGLTGTLFSAGLLVSLLVFPVVLFRRERRSSSGISLALLVILSNLGFFLLQPRIPREVRYLTAAVPMVYVLFASGLLSLWRLRARLPKWTPALALVCVLLACSAFLSLGAGATRTVRELLARPDPMPIVETVLARGYAVCFAASGGYELQFLAGDRVAFVPYMSLDRNPRESARARTRPGPRCLVDAAGNVRDFLPSDEAEDGAARRRALSR